MAKEITMPKLSDTMEEGKVLRWLKGEGDRVERGEVIAEVETDKADMEMEAFDSGVLLSIEVGEGETAPVGEVIAWIGQPGERLDAKTGGAGTPAPPAGREAERPKGRPAREPGREAAEAEDVEAGVEASEEEEPQEAIEGDEPEETAERDVPRRRPAAAERRGERAPGRARAAAGAVREEDERTAPAARRPRDARAIGTDGDGRRVPAPGKPVAAPSPRGDVPGPHADIADVIDLEVEEEAEGEEGSARQVPPGTQPPPSTPRPSKGLNDRLPFRPHREERGERVRISPLARRLAREAGLDPAAIEGSGPGGRIVRADVERALSRGAPGPTSGAVPARAHAAREGAREPRPAPAAAPPVPVAGGELGAELPHSRMRRAVASRMAESKRTIPHFYTTVAVRMERALELKEALELRHPGERVGITHLLTKAAALAIERYPRVNAVFEEERIRILPRINIGIAVAVEDGLLVPVVKDCAGKALLELARESRAAVSRAQGGKLAQDDLQGGTFSISNMGIFPIEQFAAIITPPQSAILAVGAMADEPVVRDGAVVPGKVVRLTLSADHRVIDGALAAAFLAEMKDLLEAPLSLVV